MAFSRREADDLVLERGTVTRTDSLNLAVIERRLAEIRRHQFSDSFVGVNEIARDLLDIERFGQERERDRRVIAGLEREPPIGDAPIERDGGTMQAGRRAGFQSPPDEAKRFERLGQIARGWLAGAAG